MTSHNEWSAQPITCREVRDIGERHAAERRRVRNVERAIDAAIWIAGAAAAIGATWDEWVGTRRDER